MERRLLVPLVVGLLLVVISVADPQAQYQLRRPLQMNAQTRTLPQNRFIGPKDPQVQYQLRPPLQMNAQTRTLPQNRFIGPKGVQTQYQFPRPVQMNAQSRNFLPNRFSAKKAGHYPPVPPGTGGQLPGDSRNFIPNRFDIPASVIDKKPGTSVGCVGADPCGLVAPYSPPALPIPPPPPAYTGFPPPQVPYGPQGYALPPPMATDGFGMHSINSLAQNTAAAVAAKAKLLGGIHPRKKFVPHLPAMGRPQQGKPPYDPPPPPPEPQAAGYAQAGQLPYQQPFGYGQQGMVPPQAAGYAPQPAIGFAQPGAPPMQGTFADQQAFTAPAPLPQEQTPFAPQQPSPLGPQQQDAPQPINNNAPQVPFPPEMNQAPSFNDPGQQVTPEGSFDLAKKRMMAMQAKGQLKRFGVPRPVLKSRLVPKPLFKRRN